MIGVIIVAHGKLAEELLKAAQHVVGEQAYVETVNIIPQDSDDDARDAMMKAVSRCNTGKGVMILTDMFGGVPSNLAMSLLGHGRIEVVAGVNLPMLIRLFSIRKDTPLEKTALKVQEAGRKYINIASVLLSNESDSLKTASEK